MKYWSNCSRNTLSCCEKEKWHEKSSGKIKATRKVRWVGKGESEDQMKWEQRQEKSRGKVKAAKKVRWMGSRNVGNIQPTPYNWVRWYWSDYCIYRDSDISLPGWYSTVPEYLIFQFQKSVQFDIYQLQSSSDGFLQHFIWRNDHLFVLYGNRSNEYWFCSSCDITQKLRCDVEPLYESFPTFSELWAAHPM